MLPAVQSAGQNDLSASPQAADFEELADRRTLADVLSRGPLALPQALSYAAQVAKQLRDLHAAGNVHGLVSSPVILVEARGAKLPPSLAYPGEQPAQCDVQGWGTVLQEMLAGQPNADDKPFGAPLPANARKGPEAVLPAARRLARKCLARSPERLLTMQQAYNEVRLLAVLARQYHLDGLPAPVAPKPRTLETVTPAPVPLRTPGTARLTPVEDKYASRVAPAACAPCPRCDMSPVYLSTPRTLMERLVSAWGTPICRCHRCLHRWLMIGKRRFDRPTSHRLHSKASEQRG